MFEKVKAILADQLNIKADKIKPVPLSVMAKRYA